MALGTATLVVVHRVAVRLSGEEVVGDVAFVLALGYGMLRFYETKLMSETLGLFLLACSLWFASGEGCRRGRPGPAMAAGVCLGLGVLREPPLRRRAHPAALLLPVA
jgi:hypothetical protein